MSPRLWLARMRLLAAQAHLDVACNGTPGGMLSALGWWLCRERARYIQRRLLVHVAPPAAVRALDRQLAWHVLSHQQALVLFRARFEELWPEEKWG